MYSSPLPFLFPMFSLFLSGIVQTKKVLSSIALVSKAVNGTWHISIITLFFIFLEMAAFTQESYSREHMLEDNQRWY